jgi:hypothetical protein
MDEGHFRREDAEIERPAACPESNGNEYFKGDSAFLEKPVSVHELEAAVANLPRAELAKFAEWFENYLADAWDRQIEDDIRAGRLDEAGRQADADFEAGRAKPL